MSSRTHIVYIEMNKACIPSQRELEGASKTSWKVELEVRVWSSDKETNYDITSHIVLSRFKFEFQLLLPASC